mgnify:CR=1 FL=1
MVEPKVSCWVIDHPAHAQALLPFIKEGSTNDLIVATIRPDVKHLIAESEGIMPRREIIWVERPAGPSVGKIGKVLIARRRIKQIERALRGRQSTEREIEQVIAIAAPLELIAAKRAGVKKRLYISDNEIDHISHRLALRSANQILVPESWNQELDGGFLLKVNKANKSVHRFPGNKSHVYLRPATIATSNDSGKRILVRRLIGGGVHDSEMISLGKINLDCTIDEHTEGDMIEQPWSLPNNTLNYHGVITQSVSLATESASLGVPTLLVSKAKRGVFTSLVELGVLTTIQESNDQNGRFIEWLENLENFMISEWPDALNTWRDVIQN